MIKRTIVLIVATVVMAVFSLPASAETPIQDGCGEAPGIIVPDQNLQGLEDLDKFGEVAGIQVCGDTTDTGMTTAGYLAEPIYFQDTDGDGCSDIGEMRENARMNANIYDPTNPHDNPDLTGGRGVPHDGVTDAIDLQAIAFRWGVEKGHPIYNDLYNVEPDNNGPNADTDIDSSDLQWLAGRFGFTCPLMPHIGSTNDFNEACDYVFMELEEVDSGSTGCFVNRDETGNIVAVFEIELVQTGSASAICVAGCLPNPVNPGQWYSAQDTADYAIHWPMEDEVCLPWIGCHTIIPNFVDFDILRFEMTCHWNWFDGPTGNPWDGATTDHNCEDVEWYNPFGWYELISETHLSPLSTPGSYKVTGRVNGFIGVLTVQGIGPREYTVKLRCSMGPSDNSYCWEES